MTPNPNVLAHDELEQRVGAAGLEVVDVVVGELCEHGVAVAEQIGLVDVNVHFAVSTIGLHQHVRRSCGCEDEEGKAELAELYDEKGKRGKPSAEASAVCFDLDCAGSVEIEAEGREIPCLETEVESGGCELCSRRYSIPTHYRVIEKSGFNAPDELNERSSLVFVHTLHAAQHLTGSKNIITYRFVFRGRE